MSKKESDSSKSTRMTSITMIVVAALGLIGTLAVGYWQFARNPENTVPVTESSAPVVKVVYYGRIIDINSNIPVRDAKVGLYMEGVQQITYTDSEGVYQFILNVKSDINGLVVVEAQGYEIYTRNVIISMNARTLEDIRLTERKIVQSPTADVVFPAVTSVPTIAPLPTTTPEVSDILVGMIDIYFSCINNAIHNERDDYVECWNLLSNKPGEFQENLNNNSGGLESYIAFWNTYKISYNLYYCPRRNDRHVNAEYYLYKWDDLSKPHSRDQIILEFSFALDGNGWRIKGGKVLNNKVSSYCEDLPRVIRPVPNP